ncbi:MAG: hypothetical protein EOM43_07430 [Gammaproteobacteria bacterium]|nr:hypothetical protein [Gammaproteobacteria bacterium]
MKILEQGGGASSATGARARITIISPGQGSSGYYPPETIAEAASLFPKGTHMYLDHATESERAERGVRSLEKLVAVFESDAELTPSGALVADVKIMPAWQPFVREAYPYIGVSISASGEIEESAEHGRTITRLTAVESVDFVTKAGRGGKIDALLESAAPVTESTARDKETALRDLGEGYLVDYDDQYVYLESGYDMDVVVIVRRPYTWDGVTAKLTGGPEKVTRETIYHPAGGITESENHVTVTITESEHKDLLEAAEKGSKVAQLEKQIADLQAELEKEKAKATVAESEAVAAKESAVRAEAGAIIEEAFTGIEAPVGKARLLEAVNVAEFDADAFRTVVTEAAAEYATAPTVTGMGKADITEAAEPADSDILEALKGEKLNG